MFKKILFVCVGNICRSPTAEYWARAQLEKAGITDLYIYSAGLSAMVGSSIHKEMKLLLDQENIDASEHIAQQVTAKHVNDAEIIFVMEDWHKKELSVAFPSGRGKIFCLGQWKDEIVVDPYRKEKVVYQEVFDVIKQNWELWQKKLWNG
ncbi:MAG: Phosphotyrosine protein phosphatase [uncultured bacterium]|nr:MAG: Phosphotyrosine protein phosphatase [uncultured bacterium]OGT25476.1 MAG: hypothetical protein A3B71_05380 [Gammaproteobacteria bacterium RIFCSPHIGHO2_02_FULL_42_43]OGT27544.1 MAG: hypothetical protein A2624_03830 [Gammaproteobacteria bacterium RIFCSPHIGHO2_01_FULL_42_8]OGT51428.1 MAG: hypothetical protein A3E54_05145 [Gammaproteobacteria bacterium RIFCSPHIGHO2_12_FULL_41_25]OGT62130.1 MAG: hypothetical protein A3I77_04080 [Gammaproteobacteria bacterium RIFCSPLOWO2_02_FULL_42_14]OGT858